MSDMDSRKSTPDFLPIMPRANGFRKNMGVAEVPLLVPPQTDDQATEIIPFRMRDIRFGAVEAGADAAMDFSVTAKKFKRSGKPNFRTRPIEGERMNLAEPDDPFDEPLD